VHSNGRKTRSKTEDLQRISKTLVLAMQFSKFQPRRLPIFWVRLAGGGMRDPEQSSTESAPVLPIEKATAPLPQNRAVKAGRHDVSVVPATARLLELRRARAAGWCAGVEWIS